MGWRRSVLHRAALAAALSLSSIACAGLRATASGDTLDFSLTGAGATWAPAPAWISGVERSAAAGREADAREPDPGPVEVAPPSLGFPLIELEEGFAPVSLDPTYLMGGHRGPPRVSVEPPRLSTRLPSLEVEEGWGEISLRLPGRRTERPVTASAPDVSDVATSVEELRLAPPVLEAPRARLPDIGRPCGMAPAGGGPDGATFSIA